jgi:hypothetical protein
VLSTKEETPAASHIRFNSSSIAFSTPALTLTDGSYTIKFSIFFVFILLILPPTSCANKPQALFPPSPNTGDPVFLSYIQQLILFEIRNGLLLDEADFPANQKADSLSS